MCVSHLGRQKGKLTVYLLERRHNNNNDDDDDNDDDDNNNDDDDDERLLRAWTNKISFNSEKVFRCQMRRHPGTVITKHYCSISTGQVIN